jgi:hypothetical protein
VIDVNLTTAAFPLDSSPGRHLAIFGSQASGSEVLDAARSKSRLGQSDNRAGVRHRLLPSDRPGT